ncbi:MAG TPA: TRAP transporter small permease [Kiloniellaceae bacterium]|nr:TRAP transporter small permease [Kiloniellaceae bacterium]
MSGRPADGETAGAAMTGPVAIVRKALGLLLLAMVLLNVANAAGRYLFRFAIPGSDEILVFAMVWLVFLAACVVFIERGHLNFGLLATRLPAAWQGPLQRIVALTTAVLCGFLAYQSWQVLTTLARVGQKSMASEIPMVVPHAAVPLSLGIIALFALYRAFRPPGTAGP